MVLAGVLPAALACGVLLDDGGWDFDDVQTHAGEAGDGEPPEAGPVVGADLAALAEAGAFNDDERCVGAPGGDVADDRAESLGAVGDRVAGGLGLDAVDVGVLADDDGDTGGGEGEVEADDLAGHGRVTCLLVVRCRRR
ncbi:hypothetical protein GCM10027273_45250 [Nocardioides pakistanensis]